MGMVGHEAVRNYCKLLVSGSAHDLREGEFDGRCIEEPLRFGMTAERQEIPIQTRVAKRPQVPGAMVRHVSGRAMVDPTRPAEAGRYGRTLRPDATAGHYGRT